MQLSLEGQVALVSGASSGIGAAVAEALAAAGAAVVINYRRGAEPARALARRIVAAGGRAQAIKADVSREGEVQRLFDKAVDAFERLDILVANSGVQRDAPFHAMSLDDWKQVLDVNLGGQFLCARAAVRQFRAQGIGPHSRALGKIIHMSSVHDRIPWAGRVNYAASKGGVDMLMRSLAQEVASQGIRVNAVSPGAIATAINSEVVEDAQRRRELLGLIPYGRIGDVEDVANAVLWLASDASDYVTGTTLYVDGGMTLYPEFRDNG